MLCARECPDWCIYIEGHKYQAPPRREGGKPRQKNALDRFDIDYSLCMYCGICVEVCPFEALFWSPEYEYSEPHIADLLHDKEPSRRVDGDRARLRALRGRLRGRRSRRCPMIGTRCSPPSLDSSPRTSRSACIAAVMIVRRAPRRHHQERRARRPVPGARARRRRPRIFILLARRVRRHHPGARLHRRHRRAVPVRHHAHPGAARAARRPRHTSSAIDRRRRSRVLLAGVLGYVALRRLPRHAQFGWLRRRADAPTEVSDSIFSTYLIPFEVVSVLLLAALIGAIVLARRD